MKQYDVIIIGWGGGLKLRPIADLWKKIAIIEKEALGGTCLNKGCIPSKMLIYPSDLLTHFKEDAEKLNIKFEGTAEIDFEAIIKRVQQDIKKTSDSIAPNYEKHENIDLYHAHAKFIENNVIEVDGQKITAKKIYIATGSKPQIPNIPGLADTPFFTSKEALSNPKKPKKMIVIGGGYIATELGHFYGAAGVDVQFLVRSEILKNEDKDIRAEFSRDFEKRYSVNYGLSPTKVAYSEGIFTVSLKDRDGNESTMISDALFVATGVVPNTQDLGLENTDIQTNNRGYITVNEYLETGASGVYALWDVVGNYLFRHSVNFEGEYLLEQYKQNTKPYPIVYPAMPHAVFSYPQIAWVWVTEDELIAQGKELGIDYVTSSNDYSSSAMGDAMKAETGLVKLIADKKTGTLIWAHIVGEKASDIIHMLIVYVSQKIDVREINKQMIFIHPALSETIRNAIRKIEKMI